MKNTSQAQITLLRKLKQRKYRMLEGKFIMEGQRAIDQALKNGILDIEAIFINASQLDHYKGYNEKLHLMDHTHIKEFSDTETPQGILALCAIPESKSMDDIAAGSGMIVATDSIQDPGNMGTIIRSAVWYGCSALLLGTGSVDIFNQKVVRSTAGATGVLSYSSGELSELLKELSLKGWEILLLDGNTGSIPINKKKVSSKTVLVIGNEGNGLSEELTSQKYTRVLLPSHSPQMYVESLNAGVAASIAMAIVNN